MAQSSATLAALTPVTMVHGEQSIDMALPSTVAVAELLPGVVTALGRLNAEAATHGFRVMLPTGKELRQDRSLSAQDVTAGSVLTLEAVGAGVTDLRYDDLVEAIGTSVDANRVAWQRGDSIRLSCYSATALFGVAASLLIYQDQPSLLSVSIVTTGAVLVALAAAVLVRIPVTGGAVAMALTTSVLLGTVGYAMVPGPATGLRLGAAGLGCLCGAAACLVLPERLRYACVAPLTIGTSLAAVGALTGYLQVPPQRAASLIVTLVALLVLTAPWFGLAQVPARIDALAVQPRTTIDGEEVRRQVAGADVAALAIRIAAGGLVAGLVPVVAVNPIGAALAVSVGVAFVLGTRTLYGRDEVMAGAISGTVVLVATGITLAVHLPDALAWLAGLMVVVGSFVVAWNVISAAARPWLNRLADMLHLVALLALLPLTALAWGII
ncbi:MAG: EsaB/YukD family protein [Propionibacteriaceae bacterium]|nr:EsaB/YukD family protein [Propionibacteriaceae bacterium]